MILTVDQVADVIFTWLGRPDPTTEIASATIADQWNIALDTFNDDVGVVNFRTMAASATVQRYNTDNLFIAATTYYASGTVISPDVYYASSTLVSPDTFYASGVTINPDYYDLAGALVVPELISNGTQVLTPAVWSHTPGTMTASATYYASGVTITPDYYDIGINFYASSTLVSPDIYYASGTVVNPDYYDAGGVLIVPQVIDTDGTIIQTPAVWSHTPGTMTASATYYASGTTIHPDYWDIGGSGGTLLVPALIADGTQIQIPATYVMDGSLQIPRTILQAEVISDGTQVLLPAVYNMDGTLIETPAVIADGTQIDPTSGQPIEVRRVKEVFFVPPDSDIYNLLDTSSDEGGFLSEDITMNLINRLRRNQGDTVFQRNFSFQDPNTLLLIPAPTVDETLLVQTQEPYTAATLPEKYEKVVTILAKALSLEVLANARNRLATPMRAGDFVKYAGRERVLFERVDKLREEYNAKVCTITDSRIF